MQKHLSAAVLALFTLTACGPDTDAQHDEPTPNIEPIDAEQTAESPDEPEEPTEETSESEPLEGPTSEENISERGSLILEPGDEGVVLDEAGNELLIFTVHSIDINPQCTGQFAQGPEKDAFVVFDAEIESDLTAGDYYLEPGLFFNQYSYRIIDAEGVTLSEPPVSDAAFECFPESEQMPAEIGPGEKASGKVVFDVPADGRTLLMNNEMGQDLQWEWNY